MKAKRGFVCPTCGKSHEGLPKDVAYTLPDDVFAVPEAERKKRAFWNADLCSMDDRYFIRCILNVPFAERANEHFGWGVWVEVDSNAFRRYAEIYERDASDEPTQTGRLANAIRGYSNTLAERVTITFSGREDRPELFLHEDSSPLARDQMNGITEARYHDLLEMMGYLR